MSSLTNPRGLSVRKFSSPVNHLLYLAEVAGRMGGKVERQCPICGYAGKFKAFGHPPRYDAQCRGCSSLERHRLFALALEAHPVLTPGAELVHFAPEKPIADLLKSRGVRYRSADLVEGRGDLALNLEKIDLPDGALNVVVANHVLEHVNDRLALAELFRVISPGGWLIATVPLVEGWGQTYENAAVTSPEDRDLHFGQWDHVRYYGRDFRDRVAAAGFQLTEFSGSGEQTVKHGLLRGECVFFAHKA